MTPPLIQVVHLGRNPLGAQLAVPLPAPALGNFAVQSTPDTTTALTWIEQRTAEVVVVDLDHSPGERLGLISQVHALDAKLPVIIRGPAEADHRWHALMHGAADYLDSAAGSEMGLCQAMLAALEKCRLQEAYSQVSSSLEVSSDIQRRTSQLFHSVLNALPLQIALVDRSGCVLLANEAWRRFPGRGAPGRGGIGENYLQIGTGAAGEATADDRKAAEGIRAVIAGTTPYFGMEYECRDSDRPAWFHLMVTPLGSNSEQGAVIVHVDITERKLAETALLEMNQRLSAALNELSTSQELAMRQDRLRALGLLVSGIAHDFNNLLSPILGYAEILLANQEIPRHARERLQLIRTSAEDAAALVNRLQLFYRSGSERTSMGEVDLAAVMRQIPDLTRPKWRDEAQIEGRMIDLELDLVEVRPAYGSATELRELLTNLVINSVDAMPRGGTIWLRLREVGADAVIEVADDGDGMTPDVISHCFEPFFSTKGLAGSGLGLSVCHGIVARHHGRIDIESAPGQGTLFRIRLPLLDGRRVPADQASIELPSYRVLYVDDDDQVRPVIARMLAQLGQQVETASSGIEALAIYGATPYDMLITDLGMPGMSGHEMTRAAKSLRPRSPVVLLTGWLYPEHRLRDGEATEWDHVVRKPVSLEKLREMLLAVRALKEATISRPR